MQPVISARLFEQLSLDVMSHIVVKLNEVTGTKGIVNEADIPVILKYTSNLACTNKWMNATINNFHLTDLFLKSLSGKYHRPPEHFAAVLNTAGARQWLWKYIKDNKYDEVYQVIQDIYELTSEALKEVKEKDPHFNGSETRTGWPSPNSYCYQTKHGFLLYIHEAPNHIATPFGQIQIFNAGHLPSSNYLISEIFITRLNATFDKLPYKKGTISEITFARNGTEEEVKTINAQEVESKQGTQNLIIGTSYSIYKIRQIKNRSLPDATHHESEKSSRSHELVDVMWEMLEKERLKKDPLLKEVQERRSNNKPETPLFRNLSEVSPWGMKLIEQLAQQPVFRQESRVSNICTKTLVLENDGEARTLTLLNGATAKFLNDKIRWHISTFDHGEGVELYLSNDYKPCDLNTLRTAYDSVLKDISLHWVKSSLKDYPDIRLTQSEEEYVLFIKKEKSLPNEVDMLSNLAGQLGISQFVRCYDQWAEEHPLTPSNVKIPYLWIKKDKLKEATQALNFQLDP